MSERPQYPKCQMCKEEMDWGYVLKREHIEGAPPLYLCDDCRELLGAVVHDSASGIFESISNLTGSTETWKENLESWKYKEGGKP